MVEGNGTKTLLQRWARSAVNHPWRVIGGWVVGIALLVVLTLNFGGVYADVFTIPGAESQQALDVLEERFPQQAGDSAQIVFKSATTLDDPAVKPRIDQLLAEAATLPEVMMVMPPEMTGAISPNGQTAYATVQYAKGAAELDRASIDALTELVAAAGGDGLQVEAGGQVVQELPETGIAEIVGVVAAVIILLITFGSIVAMGLPIVTAILGVALAIFPTLLLSAIWDFSTITTSLVGMMGLGVGIDYALFIINRFREERSRGHSIDDAVVTAIDTAGRAVLFAGTIVVIALLGLFAVGIPFIGFLGFGGAIVVAFSMAIAIGLMPALLRLLGRAIERWTILPNRRRPIEQTFGFKHTTRVQRHPVAWLETGLVILAALAAPALLNAELGSADAGTNPADTTTRKAYDLVAEGFGPGANGPLLVVVDGETALDQAAVGALAQAIAPTERVVAVTPPMFNEAANTAVFTVIPATAPQDPATTDLMTMLREEVIPSATARSGFDVYVGGATAAFADLSTKTAERLPLFILIVAGLSVLILMGIFRSIVIPLKAAVLNLMSFFAAYGVVVLVFQEGVFGLNELIGLDRTGPIESFMPIFLFGILFGLSMDYEVFLISRVHEAWTERHDNNWALSHGIGASGRVVLAAGAIMTSVFLAFVLGESRIIKEIGLALGAAIVVDVLVVRFMIVPSFMTLVGARNWWFPSWLDRIVPRLAIEGRPPSAEVEAAPAD